MKKALVGLSMVIVLLTAGSVILPALVSVADAGWFGLFSVTQSITTVSPTGVHSGSPSFALVVNGTNFVSNSVVRWNGADRSTTYVSPERLTATILDTDVAAVGTASVTVFNPGVGGGESNAATVSINTKTNTTTTIVSDLPDPSQISEPVTVAYTVTASAGTPAGTVTVTDSASSASCSGSVAAGSCTLTLVVAGKRTLTATYSGDATFNDSSGSAAHVVLGQYFPFVAKQPTPTPTPTRTPVPIPNPIQNGGFESAGGPWLSAWCIWPSCSNLSDWFGIDTRADSGQLNTQGASPHTGNWAAWLGGQSNIQMRMDQQSVTVPAGGSTLRYWLWIQSGETTCNINDVNGAWVFFITSQQNTVDSYPLCTANATSGWTKHDVNLSAYANQTGWLTFYTRILGANSNWFIDDVAMGTLSGAQFAPFRR